MISDEELKRIIAVLKDDIRLGFDSSLLRPKMLLDLCKELKRLRAKENGK